MLHFRERGRCSLILARKLNFHSMIIYSFSGGIFPASWNRKPQKVKADWVVDFSPPPDSGDVGHFENQALGCRGGEDDIGRSAVGWLLHLGQNPAGPWARLRPTASQGCLLGLAHVCISSAFTRLVFGSRQKLHYKMSDWFKWPCYNKERPWHTYKKVSLLREVAFFHAGFLLYDMLLLFFFTISHAGKKDIQ